MRAASVAVLLLMAASLAGCSSGGGAGNGSSGSQTQRPGVGGPLQADGADDDPRIEGVNLQAQAFGDAGHYTLEAILSNDGNTQYVVHKSCGEAVVQGMRRDGEFVVLGPARGCPDSDEPWAPYANEHPTFEWDGRLWDDAQGAYVPAPPGTYEWTAGATLRTSASAPEAVSLRVTFTIEFT